MAIDVIMPQLGESIAEGTVVKWLIAQGGRVEKDQSLLEVETDKVSLEVPSPASGILTEVLVKEGETVPVGTLLARMESAQPAKGAVARVGGVVIRHMEPPPGEEDHYSPAVLALAKEHQVDLSQVTGTGAGGRVTKKDVLAAVAKHGAAQPAPTPTPKRAEPGRPTEAPAAGVEQVVALTAMRKTIAERMVASRRASAHVSTFFEADLSSVAHIREAHRLTYLPFVAKAVTRALRDVPVLNASWSDQGIVLKRDIHLGIAVALEDGLLVPVIRDADRKGLRELGSAIADLADRARSKRLNPEEVQGGTFTITNHGGMGSLFSTPIIHQPQIAILGVGTVQKRAVVIHDAIAIRPMAYLSLSFDHRVIDGATADRFMTVVKQGIESTAWEEHL